MRFILFVLSFVYAFIFMSGCASSKPGEHTTVENLTTKIKNKFSVHTSLDHKEREEAERERLMKKWAEEKKAKKEAASKSAQLSKSAQSESLISVQSDSLISTQPES